MSITVTAIEGTLIVAAAIIPIILFLGSVEKLVSVLDEVRYRNRLRKQVRLLRANLGEDFKRAA